jgi:DNA-binding beta-propeller fold protein YncE
VLGRRALLASALSLALGLAGSGACSSGPDRPAATSLPTPAEHDLDVLVVDLGGRPSAIAHGHGALWVADDERGVVVRLDPADGTQLGEPISTSARPTAIAVGDDAIWVSDPGGALTRIDPATGTRREVEIGGAPVDLLAEGPRVWVGDIGAGTVRALGPDGWSTEPVALPGGVVRLAFGGGRLWASGLERTVTPVDPTTGDVGATVEVGEGPIGMAVVDGVLWIADSDDGTVSRVPVDGASRPGPPIPVGRAPVALAADGAAVWVLAQDARTLTRLAAVDGAPRGTVELPMRPRALVATPVGVWVVGVDPAVAVRVR